MSTGLDMSAELRSVGVAAHRPDGWKLTYEQLRRLRFLEASARTKRWHTEPTLHTQSVGEHTYGVLQLVLLLEPAASRELLIAALMHDTAERKFGDVPGPTKRLAGVKGKFDELEDAFMAEMGLPAPNLSEREAKLLKLCDMLEGAMFCAFELRRGNREIQEGFFNYLTWIEAAPHHSPVSAAIYNQLRSEYVEQFCQ